MPREPWTYSPAYGTALDLNYCQFGFKMDQDCDAIGCKFRTTKEHAPAKAMESCRVACPREREYEQKSPQEARIS